MKMKLYIGVNKMGKNQYIHQDYIKKEEFIIVLKILFILIIMNYYLIIIVILKLIQKY